MNDQHENNASDDLLNAALNEYQVDAASSHLHARILASAPQAETNQRQPIPDVEAGFSTGIAEALRDLLSAMGGWRIAGPAIAASFVVGITVSLWTDVPSDSSLPASTWEDSTIWELALLANTDIEESTP